MIHLPNLEASHLVIADGERTIHQLSLTHIRLRFGQSWDSRRSTYFEV